MASRIPATFLVPDEAGVPLEITLRHDALRMAVIDRDQFDAATARGWDVPGIYLLFGQSADEAPGRYAVYVGKAAPGSIAGRIRTHVRDKEGWDRALLATRSSEEGFNSTDVGWLEGALHAQLKQATLAELLNVAGTGDDTIADWDRVALERVLAAVLGVMRALGYRPDRVSALDDDLDQESNTGQRPGMDVDLVHTVINTVQPGEWATYGDVAAASGTHPRALGSHIRHCTDTAPEWRILNARGESQPGFTWATRGRTGSQTDVLASEGLAFDERGFADPNARVQQDELANRVERSTA